jgi:hypothetical protein
MGRIAVDWQQPAALIVVASALVLMVRKLMSRGKRGARLPCAGCGCRGPDHPPGENREIAGDAKT